MTRFNEFIVGVVFICAMTVLGYFTIIRGEFFEKRQYYTMTVLFDSVEGMSKGDAVLVNGVPGGKVVMFELLPDSRVKVTVKMYLKFTLYENYRMELRSQSALGGKALNITPGKPEVDGMYYDEVQTRENLAGTTLGDPFTLIAEVINENRNDIRTSIANLSEFTEKINNGEGTIARLVNEDTVHDEAGKTLKQVRDTIEDSREQAPVTSFIRAALTFF